MDYEQSHLSARSARAFCSLYYPWGKMGLKTQGIGPAPGIEPATFRSAVKCSIDWATELCHD